MKRGGRIQTDPAVTAARRRRREARRADSLPPAVRHTSLNAPNGYVAASPHAWWQTVTKDGCVMCKHFPVDSQTARDRSADIAWPQAHHLIEKGRLKQMGLRSLIHDVRNGLCLCRFHHERHTNATQRVPQRLVPAAAREFADAIDALWMLEDERMYPS